MNVRNANIFKHIIRRAFYPFMIFSVVAVMFIRVYAESPSQNGTKLKLIGKIGPIKENLFHVQGLDVATDTIFISSVDKDSSSGYLWKIDRKTLNVVEVKNFAKSFMYHPSGLQYDGRYLWMAIAFYTEKSGAEVLKIEPAAMKAMGRVKVSDHIGLAASDGRGRIIGANWDAKKFYFWDEKGKPSGVRGNPSGRSYQDCKLFRETLVCSGGGAVDFINVDKWKVEKTYVPGKVETGDDATREGMDFHDGVFYFLPSDGRGTYIYMFSER